MARASAFVAGLALGVVLGTAVMIGHADDVQAEVNAAAAVANVDPVDLYGAVNTTGMGPREYLQAVGEWPALVPENLPPRVYTSQVSARVECIIRLESRGDPNARNRSGASGLGQFLPATWLSTPQGRAGYSVFNAAANRQAIAWMLSVGRAREFVAVSTFGC